MWRSFFYAIGVGLFILGLQALVLDHVTVPRDTKLQKLVRKILDDDKPSVAKAPVAPPAVPTARGAANNPNPSWLPGQNSANWQRQARDRGWSGVDTGSRFGPSRFSGPAYGTGYGGPRIGSTAPLPSRSPGASAQFAGYRSNGTPGSTVPTVKTSPAVQPLAIREWMPWSLLAAGAIIFFYTHTWHRRGSHD